MNRRIFLKRIAAVAAGTVAVPTIASTLTTQDVMDAVQVPWTSYGMTYKFKRGKGQHITATIWDEIPKHPVGTRYYAADGQVFVYAKAVNGFTKVGGLC